MPGEVHRLSLEPSAPKPSHRGRGGDGSLHLLCPQTRRSVILSAASSHCPFRLPPTSLLNPCCTSHVCVLISTIFLRKHASLKISPIRFFTELSQTGSRPNCSNCPQRLGIEFSLTDYAPGAGNVGLNSMPVHLSPRLRVLEG